MNRKRMTAVMVFMVLMAITGCGSSDPGWNVYPNILAGTTYKACAANTATTYAFRPDNTGSRTVQSFSDALCTVATGTAAATEFTYSVDGQLTERNDFMPATKLDITEAGTTLYTIMRLSGGLLGTGELHFGSTADSSPGMDGTTDATRHDGLDQTVTYLLQP